MVSEANEIANDVKHWIVILEVPVKDGEDPPHQWNWNDLLDTSDAVHVVGTRELPSCG